jgi:hypothetical protein
MRIEALWVVGFSLWAVAMSTPVAMAANTSLVESAANNPTANEQEPYVDTLVDRANAILRLTGKDRDVDLSVALLLEAVRNNNTAAMRALAGILTKGDTGVPADPSRSEALLQQAIAAGDVVWGAYGLGDLYRADTPLKDIVKATAAYQQAADAGSGYAALALAILASNQFQSVSGRREMTNSFRKAASLLGKGPVLDQMQKLPAPALVSLMQQLLSDTGVVIAVTGVHGKQTEKAIKNLCSTRQILDCNAKFLTRPVISSIIFDQNQ